jgi:hypothetical protein
MLVGQRADICKTHDGHDASARSQIEVFNLAREMLTRRGTRQHAIWSNVGSRFPKRPSARCARTDTAASNRMQRASHAPARYEPVVLELIGRRLDAAMIHGQRAAWMKWAAARRIEGRRHFSLQNNAFFLGLGIGHRRC